MPITPKPLPDLDPQPADLSGFPPITGADIGPWGYEPPGHLWLDHAHRVTAGNDPVFVEAAAALSRDIVRMYGVPPWSVGIGPVPRRVRARATIRRAARRLARWWR